MSTNITSSSDSTLTRVYIWSLPRTLGTAVVKCMSYVDGMQIFYEPFVSAFHYGPEGMAPNKDVAKFIESASAYKVELENAFDGNICTYSWVKQQLEANYPGKKILLAKDQAYCLNERYDMIPSGFRHAFLIRHPYKVLPSWKHMLAKLMNLDNDTTSWADLERRCKQPNGYELQHKLFKYVKENLDSDAVIFDADDLQSNPASISSQFCRAVGIPYVDTLLNWPADREIMTTWKACRISLQGNLLENEGGFYESALQSTKFLPPTPVPERSELSQDLQVAADHCMPFYEEMRRMRLLP